MVKDLKKADLRGIIWKRQIRFWITWTPIGSALAESLWETNGKASNRSDMVLLSQSPLWGWHNPLAIYFYDFKSPIRLLALYHQLLGSYAKGIQRYGLVEMLNLVSFWINNTDTQHLLSLQNGIKPPFKFFLFIAIYILTCTKSFYIFWFIIYLSIGV